jgi:hypothetical protein
MENAVVLSPKFKDGGKPLNCNIGLGCIAQIEVWSESTLLRRCEGECA